MVKQQRHFSHTYIITMKRKTKKSTKKKSSIEQSKVKRGKIYCINNTKNKTPYWGGTQCESSTEHRDNIIQYVCPSCIATIMPSPVVKKKPIQVDGQSKRRGRPPGSKNKVQKVSSVKR